VKSNATQQRLNLLTKRFIFSELETSLNGTNGSINDTVPVGKTAAEFLLPALDLTPSFPPFDLLFFPPARGESLRPDESPRGDSSESGFDALKGSLLRNCFNIATQKLKSTNFQAL
jgi:hypothetical protein